MKVDVARRRALLWGKRFVAESSTQPKGRGKRRAMKNDISFLRRLSFLWGRCRCSGRIVLGCFCWTQRASSVRNWHTYNGGTIILPSSGERTYFMEGHGQARQRNGELRVPATCGCGPQASLLDDSSKQQPLSVQSASLHARAWSFDRWSQVVPKWFRTRKFS